MNLQKEFYRKLDSDKIKINWNENPIKMELFLSFLKIKTERCTNFLGHSTGWTQLINDKHKLIIKGGLVKSIEHLDNLQYGTNLDNQYNNYVNPFYLFDILNKNGKMFFLEYYKAEICDVLKQASLKVNRLKEQLDESEKLKSSIIKEIKHLESCKEEEMK